MNSRVEDSGFVHADRQQRPHLLRTTTFGKGTECLIPPGRLYSRFRFHNGTLVNPRFQETGAFPENAEVLAQQWEGASFEAKPIRSLHCTTPAYTRVVVLVT